MSDSTTTTATHSDLSEEESYERVKRIVAEAFPPGRPARSMEYRSGMTQMLLYFFCGKKVMSDSKLPIPGGQRRTRRFLRRMRRWPAPLAPDVG